MNPTEPPLQPHRSSISCNRHPDELFTSFCPSCLCERLSGLDPTSSSSSSSRKPSTSSTAAAALKSIFRPPPASSLLPELRRTKSFSASRNDHAFSATTALEPQRKSCDVRARSSVSNILSEKKTTLNRNEDEGDTKNLEEKENQEEDVVEDGDGVRVLEEPNSGNVNLEIEEEEKDELEFKTMKAHIDLNSSHPKKSSKDSKGSFWSAASVFSNKLQKWRQKQKMKKHRNETETEDVSTTLPVEKPIGRQFRETQSEIVEYGLGRRSCNTDPRFSLDIGRMSFDNDPRYSFDEPRASWDGYCIERATVPRMPTMLSVVEDAPVHVLRTDTQIPVDEPINHDDDSDDDDSNVPGGSAQTREYYDSSSRRRKSLDRSNSIMKTAATIVAEMDELKCSSVVNTNANVNASKLGGHIDGDLSSNSMRDDCCLETVELGFKDGASVIGNGDQKGSKKSRRWSKAWSIWGFIHRRGGNKDEDEDRYSRANDGARHSFSESWQDLRGDRNGNGDGRGGFNGSLFRSNSSVSWRNAQSIGGSFGTLRRNVSQSNGHGKKAKDEFVLERNKSARYSPKDIDHGLLRLYLTPSRGSRRNGSTKSSNQSYSIARTVPRMY